MCVLLDWVKGAMCGSGWSCGDRGTIFDFGFPVDESEPPSRRCTVGLWSWLCLVALFQVMGKCFGLSVGMFFANWFVTFCSGQGVVVWKWSRGKPRSVSAIGSADKIRCGKEVGPDMCCRVLFRSYRTRLLEQAMPVFTKWTDGGAIGKIDSLW